MTSLEWEAASSPEHACRRGPSPWASTEWAGLALQGVELPSREAEPGEMGAEPLLGEEVGYAEVGHGVVPVRAELVKKEEQLAQEEVGRKDVWGSSEGERVGLVLVEVWLGQEWVWPLPEGEGLAAEEAGPAEVSAMETREPLPPHLRYRWWAPAGSSRTSQP